MKTILSAAIAAAALVSSVPAFAQPMPPGPGYGPPPGAPAPGGWALDRRIGWLQQRVDRGLADGSLDRREGWRVRQELIRIRRQEDYLRAQHGGRLWDRDRMMLQDRLDRVSEQIHWLRANNERRPW